MQTVTTIGLDIAKSVFQVHGVDAAASYGFSREFAQFAASHPVGLDPGTVSGRVLLHRKIVHVPDVLADPEYNYGGQKIGGFRTVLGVPLLREGSPIGVIALGRNSVRPFTDRQIELVEQSEKGGVAIGHFNVALSRRPHPTSRRELNDSSHRRAPCPGTPNRTSLSRRGSPAAGTACRRGETPACQAGRRPASA